MNKRFGVSLFAVVMAVSIATVPYVSFGSGIAAEQGEVQDRVMTADVEDTFMRRDCVLGRHNVEKYDVTYRTLRFTNSYAKVGQRVIDQRIRACAVDPSHYAEYLKIQYEYRTW